MRYRFVPQRHGGLDGGRVADDVASVVRRRENLALPFHPEIGRRSTEHLTQQGGVAGSVTGRKQQGSPSSRRDPGSRRTDEGDR